MNNRIALILVVLIALIIGGIVVGNVAATLANEIADVRTAALSD